MEQGTSKTDASFSTLDGGWSKAEHNKSHVEFNKKRRTKRLEANRSEKNAYGSEENVQERDRRDCRSKQNCKQSNVFAIQTRKRP